MKTAVLCLFALMLPTGVFAAPEIKGNPEELRGFLHPDPHHVVIQGEAIKVAYSDEAYVSLVVSANDKALSEAIANNRQLRTRVTSDLVTAGIDQQNIKSSRFSTSPQYGWFGKTPESYNVVNRIAVKALSDEQFEAIARVADNHKHVEFSGAEFKHADASSFKNQVNALALDDAMQKRKFYEDSLGVKLLPIIFGKVSLDSGATKGALVLNTAAQRQGKADSSFLAKGRGAYEAAPSVGFDEVHYRATISVTFKVVQQNK